MTQLAEFQDGFARALISLEPPPDLPPQLDRMARQLAFSVYRNTVLKGWLDALEANFPAVAALVGEEWFRAAAAVYARANPPRNPMLVLYGESFPQFLEDFEQAQDVPYLPAVARMDRMWSEAHVASDAPALAPEVFAIVPPEELAEARLVLHPTARLAWFDHTAPTIWLETRGYAPDSEDLAFEEGGEGVLIVRSCEVVRALRVDAGAAAFLSACGRGCDLAEAAAFALVAEPEVDLAALSAELLDLGAFTDLLLPDRS
jgi:hypothetical protein